MELALKILKSIMSECFLKSCPWSVHGSLCIAEKVPCAALSSQIPRQSTPWLPYSMGSWLPASQGMRLDELLGSCSGEQLERGGDINRVERHKSSLPHALLCKMGLVLLPSNSECLSG